MTRGAHNQTVPQQKIKAAVSARGAVLARTLNETRKMKTIVGYSSDGGATSYITHTHGFQ